MDVGSWKLDVCDKIKNNQTRLSKKKNSFRFDVTLGQRFEWTDSRYSVWLVDGWSMQIEQIYIICGEYYGIESHANDERMNEGKNTTNDSFSNNSTNYV